MLNGYNIVDVLDGKFYSPHNLSLLATLSSIKILPPKVSTLNKRFMSMTQCIVLVLKKIVSRMVFKLRWELTNESSSSCSGFSVDYVFTCFGPMLSRLYPIPKISLLSVNACFMIEILYRITFSFLLSIYKLKARMCFLSCKTIWDKILVVCANVCPKVCCVYKYVEKVPICVTKNKDYLEVSRR